MLFLEFIKYEESKNYESEHLYNICDFSLKMY